MTAGGDRMHVKPYQAIKAQPIENDQVQGVTMRVAIGADQGAPNFVMRVFEIAPGGHSPHHEHEFEHEIFFHAGRGMVVYEDKTAEIGPGHIAYMPPWARHQIRNTGDKPLVFICLVPAYAQQ
jgi:quercetin dioxygenase-like cupin family protein